ncbi:hypothetical protein DFH07DRAFT_820539 [Mycena maculata]|uniref:Uncharacterized protein n=1 Tax=Mycena maculata TaxID=230809 RepID=A0AAD7NCS2_9AGAR|nr:hypothetical protein DFH07DRAFT_820539 [Mycena maculata]
MATDVRTRGAGSALAHGASRLVPSIAESLNEQIEDLVQRNRTLEQINKKLADERAVDAERAKRTIRDVQTEWQEERVSWREGCNRLLSCHHLAHLRLSAKLSEVELAVLREMEVTRQERLARLHRDFQITMFGIREAELDTKIEELEDALEEARRGRENHSSDLEEQIKAQEEEIDSLTGEKSAAEKELLKLRESHSRLQVKAETTETKLERMTLQFDGAQTTNDELERQNDELKRANVDLKRQLDRWQNLETKGGEEVETLRKHRIDLEVAVKGLETRLEKKEADLQREKAKVAKHKQNVDEFQAYAEEQRQETKVVTTQLSKANKQIERLQRDLEAERAARPKSPLKKQQSPIVSEDEVANDFAEAPPPSSPAPPPSKKPRSKINTVGPTKGGRNKPATKSVAGPSNTSDSDIEEVPDPKTRTRTKAATDGSKKAKAKPRSRAAGRDSSESEDDAKGTKSKGKAKAVEEIENSDSVVPQKETSRPKTGARGKRKRDEAAGPSNQERAASVATDISERPKPQKPRGKAGRAGSVQPRGTTVISDDESDEPAKKKKKRNIGLFPANSQPASFNFLPAGDMAGGIDIPTVLSPVRQEDVPSRSGASSRTGSVFGSLLSGFSRRKP